MNKLKYNQLPEAVKLNITEKSFLYGYFLSDKQRYVVRWVDQESKGRREGEFDAASGRWLSDEERLHVTPAPAKRFLPHGVLMSPVNYIEPGSHRLRTRIAVLDACESAVLASLDVDVYPPVLEPLENAVASAIEKARFPMVYAGWDLEAKAGYWASVIHRLRRAQGETGRDEDDIFTPQLVEDFEKLDPNFRQLLPQVLPLVARLEQTTPDDMMDAFRRRVPF